MDIWSLVCDQAYIKRLTTSLQMGGVMAGALVGGQASDTLGRKVTVYSTILVHTIVSMVAAFSVSWHMFIVMRVLIGVTLGVYLVAAFSYPMEFVSPSYRHVVAFLPAWAIAMAFFALVAWQIPDWSYLHIINSLIGIPFLLTWFVIPESARWLATKGRLQEAEAVIARVARTNRRQVPSHTAQTLKHVADDEKKASQGRRYTYLDVYRGRRLAMTTLILNFIWFTMSFSYYGIAFGVSALSGNVYFNIFLMSTVEIPANFSTIFFANKLGRRWTCLLFFTLCALSNFGILLVDETVTGEDEGRAITALALISKLSVSAGWLAVTTFTSEQYPTVIRNLGYGASNTVSRVGGALAPLLLNMDTRQEVVHAYVIIGSLMVVSALVVLLLHETKGQGLQDSVITIHEKKKAEAANGSGIQNEDFSKETETDIPVWSVNGQKKDDGPSGQKSDSVFDKL